MAVNIGEFWPNAESVETRFKQLLPSEVVEIVREGVNIALGKPTIHDSSQFTTDGARTAHLFTLTGKEVCTVFNRSGDIAGDVAPGELQNVGLSALMKFGLDETWFYQQAENGRNYWFSPTRDLDMDFREGRFKQVLIFPSRTESGLSFKRSTIYRKDEEGKMEYEEVAWDARYRNVAALMVADGI